MPAGSKGRIPGVKRLYDVSHDYRRMTLSPIIRKNGSHVIVRAVVVPPFSLSVRTQAAGSLRRLSLRWLPCVHVHLAEHLRWRSGDERGSVVACSMRLLLSLLSTAALAALARIEGKGQGGHSTGA